MTTTADFMFLDPGPLRDAELSLACTTHIPADPARNFVPCYVFAMRVQHQTVGHLNLRIGHTRHLELYAGHIGYGVEPAYRGRHYAERSCRLVLPVARAHNLGPLWITCNPDNLASRKTCERLGAVLVEIVDLPPETEMYQRGERQKCRYRLELPA